MGKDKQVKRSKGRWPLLGYPMSGPNCGWGAEIQLADILRQKMGCLLAGSQRPVLHRAPHFCCGTRSLSQELVSQLLSLELAHPQGWDVFRRRSGVIF